MDKFLAVVNYIFANASGIVAAVVGVLSALIGLFMFVPGEQPEKFLHSAVDFLSKFSKK